MHHVTSRLLKVNILWKYPLHVYFCRRTKSHYWCSHLLVVLCVILFALAELLGYAAVYLIHTFAMSSTLFLGDQACLFYVRNTSRWRTIFLLICSSWIWRLQYIILSNISCFLSHINTGSYTIVEHEKKFNIIMNKSYIFESYSWYY